MDTQHIKVSVIVPVYNTEKYLPKCIESILGQKHTNLELFLIDDGSTDASFKICKKYESQDCRVKVIQQANSGQGCARNNALQYVTGDVISFIDSDDEIREDMYHKMVTAMCEEESDIAICSYSTNTQIRYVDAPVLAEYAVIGNYELMKLYMSSPYIFTGPWNKLYKKKLFEKIRFPEIRANEDACIMHEVLALCEKAVYVGEHFYIQNIRDNSTEHSRFSEKHLALLEAARRVIEFYKVHYIDLYPLVAYKEVNDIAYLLGRICKQFSYNENRELFIRLYNKLQEEYRKIKKEFPHETGLSEAARLVLRSVFLFRAKCYGEGIRSKVKRVIVIWKNRGKYE